MYVSTRLPQNAGNAGNVDRWLSAADQVVISTAERTTAPGRGMTGEPEPVPVPPPVPVPLPARWTSPGPPSRRAGAHAPCCRCEGAPRIAFEHDGKFFVGAYGVNSAGQVRELWLNMRKGHSFLDGVVAGSAIAASLGLQHGLSLTTLRHALRRDPHGAPQCPLGALIDRVIAETGADTP